MIINVTDLETTGFDPKDSGVVEIAVVQLPSMDTFQSLISPGFPIGCEVMGIHHITEDMVAGCQTLETAVKKIDLWEKVDVWAAHNAEFDKAFFPAHIQEKSWICTWRVAMHLWPDAPSHKNQALRYWLNLDVADMPAEAGLTAHRALYDAWVTAKLVQRELDEIKVKLRSEKVLGEDVPVLESAAVEELIRLTSAPLLLRKVRFGKHRDQLWSEIPSDYLRWVLKQGNFDADTVHTCRHYLGVIV